MFGNYQIIKIYIMKNTISLLIYISMLIMLSRSKSILSILEYQNIALCKFKIISDTIETRNPRTITELVCTNEACRCTLTKFSQEVGECKQLKTVIPVSFEGQSKVEYRTINHSCICVPQKSTKTSAPLLNN